MKRANVKSDYGLYWGVCPNGHRVYVDRQWREENDPKTRQVELGRKLPVFPRRIVPIFLPCGDIYYFQMQVYQRSDGTYFYA